MVSNERKCVDKCIIGSKSYQVRSASATAPKGKRRPYEWCSKHCLAAPAFSDNNDRNGSLLQVDCSHPLYALLSQNFFDTPTKKPWRGPYCGANTPMPVPLLI
jgi:hypothetical protein